MKPIRLLTLFALIPAVFAAAAGCVPLNRKHPDVRTYYLSVERPGGPAASRIGKVLQVRPFAASPACQSRFFCIRRGEQAYAEDFYHRFFVTPAQNLTEQTALWLGDSGAFEQVVQSSSLIPPTHALEGRLIRMEADYRKQPRVVIELEAALLDLNGDSPRTLIHLTLREEEPAGTGRPDELAAAWNAALARVLTRLETGLFLQ